MIGLNRVIDAPTLDSYFKLKAWIMMKRWKDVDQGLSIYDKTYSLQTSKFQHFLYGYFSNSAFFLRLRADYYLEAQRYDQAKKDYLSLLQFFPHTSGLGLIILDKLALSCYGSGDINLAYQCIKKLLEIQPLFQDRYSLILLDIARIDTEANNWKRAVECFLLGVSGDKSKLETKALYSLILCHVKNRDFNSALKCIELAFKRNPDPVSVAFLDGQRRECNDQMLNQLFEEELKVKDEENDGLNWDWETFDFSVGSRLV